MLDVRLGARDLSYPKVAARFARQSNRERVGLPWTSSEMRQPPVREDAVSMTPSPRRVEGEKNLGVAPSYVHGKGTTRPHCRNHTRRVCVRGSIGSSERRVERAHIPPTDSVIRVQRSSVNGYPRQRPLERTDMRLSVVRFLRKQASRFNGQHYGARVTPLSIRRERYTCISLGATGGAYIYLCREGE